MKWLKFSLVGALLVSVSAQADKPSVEDFFKNAQYSQVSVSPSGKYMAAIAPANTGDKSRRNIAIIDLKDRSKSKFITGLKDQDVGGYSWLSDDKLLFGVDSDGVEAIQMFMVDRKSGDVQLLIDPLPEFSRENGMPSPTMLDELEDDDDHILVSYDKRKVGAPDIYLVDIKKSRGGGIRGKELRNDGLEMVERNPGNVQGYFTDHDGKIRGAVAQDKLMTSVLHRATEEDEWETIAEFRFDDRNGFSPLGFAYDNKRWYVTSDKDHDTAAIYEYDPTTQEFGEMIFHHDDVDAGGLIWSDARKKIVGATYFGDKPGWVGFDEDYSALRKSLEMSFPDKQTSISSTDDDENLMVITVWSDTDPGSFYLYDNKKRTMEALVDSRPWINPEEMTPMRAISYESRDGLEIPGYLTLPKDYKEGDKLPLIVNPHGGPWARDTWGFNPEHQFFASRGYAVLQMNFRGSTGFGRQHLEAGYKKWGREMQNDITDGVKWAVDQGYADADRVCIYGASYGGYATMAGMVFTPELYKCGVNYVGVTDVALLFSSMKKSWDLGKETMKMQVGDPDTEAEFLAEISPVNHVENIQAPVYIVHGKRDPRVVMEHADKLRDEMEKHGKEYEWLVKNDEGHGFSKEENRLELYTSLEEFFAKHIGDKSGP